MLGVRRAMMLGVRGGALGVKGGTETGNQGQAVAGSDQGALAVQTATCTELLYARLL